MEIVIEFGLLAKLVKVGAIDAIGELLGVSHWLISPAAMRELKKHGKKYSYLQQLIAHHPIITKKLGKRERRFISRNKRRYFGLAKGELEGIAIAKESNLIYVTHESQERDLCRENEVKYMSLPMLLKALWAKQILTKREVWKIAEALEGERVKVMKIEEIMGGL